MSFDDYANHVYQKHRLAVALAIIKSKPANVKTEKYLEELKSKIDHKMDEDDITICSDDFLMDDDDDGETNDSVTILKDFDPEFVNNDGHWADGNADSAKRPTTEFTNRKIPENLSQIHYYDNSQNPTTIDTAISLVDRTLPQNKQNSNQNLDIEQSIPKNVISRDQNMPKSTIVNEFNDKMANTVHNTDITNYTTQATNPERNNAETINSNALTTTEKMDVTYYDSQKTIPYTLHGFTENYTHFSPSQNVIIVPNKYLYAVNNKNVSTVQNNNAIEGNHITAVSTNNFENETQFVGKESNLSRKIDENLVNRENIEYNKTTNMFSHRNDVNFDEMQNNSNVERDETINDVNNIKNKDTEINKIQNLNKHSLNVDEYFNEIQLLEDNEHKNNISNNNDTKKTKSNPEIEVTESINKSFRFNQNIDYNYLSQNKEFSYNKNVFQNAKDTPIVVDHQNITNAEVIPEKEALAKESSEIDTSEQSKSRREECRITEEDYELEEIISYKVLEEFNKVKSFLNRQNRRMSCDGYSTDSGYRSDSQRSANRSALKLSGNWLNQSGCCLFNYIMQCPLAAATRDITNEIAQVLSQLIDRLHEEEKYPSFLEDLLETVDLLLRQIYEGETIEDTEFLKKDEYIQRILLLNKSIHIQKHTIEKLTKILENFHSNVTETDSTYELLNIDEIENLTYIFHILEILLKKYLKNREIFSQNSTQNSQEDEKVFKKSSITDIWRKKWNPSQKVFEGSREKKCVLKSCSEILNKIVVDCVSSYSLVAYSALKCFNSMQT